MSGRCRRQGRQAAWRKRTCARRRRSPARDPTRACEGKRRRAAEDALAESHVDGGGRADEGRASEVGADEGRATEKWTSGYGPRRRQQAGGDGPRRRKRGDKARKPERRRAEPKENRGRIPKEKKWIGMGLKKFSPNPKPWLWYHVTHLGDLSLSICPLEERTIYGEPHGLYGPNIRAFNTLNSS